MTRRIGRVGRPEVLNQYFKANKGGITALAKHLGVSKSYVSNWRVVPVRHLKATSEFTSIPRQELRPDLYD